MNVETRKSRSSIITQISMAIIANLSSIAAGIFIIFPEIAIQSLMSNTNGSALNIDQVSWIADVAFFTSPVGCFITGVIADQFGRKIALLANDFVSVSGWILIVVAYYTPKHLYPLFLAGRIITGISSGMVITTPSVYIAEMSSVNLRSMLTTWNLAFISFGMGLCYLLDLCFQGNWGTIAILTAILPFMSTILILIFLPESYVWLISKQKMEHARTSIKRVFQNTEPSVTEEEINSFLEERNKIIYVVNKKPIYRQFLQRTFIMPMIIITSYFSFLNFSIVLMIIADVLTYIYYDMNITLNSYITVGLIAGTRFFSALVLGYISKFFGRRVLSIVSGVGISACMFGFTLHLFLLTKYDKLVSDSFSWIPVILLVICYFMGTIGFISIPYAMAPEIFPLDIRGIATGSAACIGYLSNFLAMTTYPFLLTAFRDNYHLLLLLHGIVALAGTIFIYFFLPETKGKALHEIEESFKSKRSVVI